jgi:lysophospholipase L1-like esterase
MAVPRLSLTFFCLLLILSRATARAEITLTNFSAVNPLKIMAVGDSITDDCVTNGAWRACLQKLLETNGYPITFVGRQTSAPTGAFNQTAHEGYCGAVIAPPGVLSYSVHGYDGTNVYAQLTTRDALTNSTPDLVLVLMGANDIGRGRDPWIVATNDMAKLLNIVFSNAPNANVILAKITSLQNAYAGSLNYGLYGSKVPIYNAALQQLVNQRRDAGQNVFLADMFSILDYFTMFLSDHLHPNPLGLQVIAGEWLTRIQSITLQSNQTVSVLVRGGNNWKYFDAGQDLGTNWMRLDYDDSGWSSGPARLGYGDLVFATKVSYGPASNNKHPTTYFRHAFVVPGNVTFTNLVLRLEQEHGSVVWLNGQELWRTNLPAGPIAYTNLALVKPANLDSPFQFNPVSVAASRLMPGTNVIAVELHQLATNSAAIGFDMELIGTGYPVSLTALACALDGTNLIFTWPTGVGDGFELFSTTHLTATNWGPVSPPAQTNGGQLIVTQTLEPGTRFFRLQKQ